MIASGLDLGDFALTKGADPLDVVDYSVDGSEVTLTLDKDLYSTVGVKLEVKKTDDPIKSVVGNEITATAFDGTIVDKVAPELVEIKAVEGTNTFTIKFTEKVNLVSNTLINADLKVYVNSDDALEADKFDVTVNENGELLVTIKAGVVTENMVTENVSVELTNGRYIVDLSDNANATTAFDRTYVKGAVTLSAE